MVTLGIDIGLSKTGVARGDSSWATPLTVIHEKNLNRLTSKIANLAQKESAEKIIIGIPEGEIVELANELGDKLMRFGMEVEFYDETLTSKDAQRLAIEAGIGQQKRHELEDAMAACVMLQSFLDGN